MGTAARTAAHPDILQTPVQQAHWTIAPALQARARSLTNDVRNLSRLPDHRVVAFSRAREHALTRLLAKDPKAVRPLMLTRRVRRVLGRIQGARVERAVELEGHFRIWHRDDFQNPAHDQYLEQLVTRRGDVLTLHGASSSIDVHLTFARLKPNTRLAVRGYALGDQILVTHVRTVPERSLASSSASTSNTGPIAVAVIFANFSDSVTPIDTSAVQTTYQGSPGADVVSYFNEASYGKASIVPSFFGPYAIAKTTSAACGTSTLLSDMMTAANADVDFTKFRRLVFVVNCPGAGGSAGGETALPTPDGIVTAAEIVLDPSSAKRLYAEVHELSHTLGAGMGNFHANFDVCLPNGFVPPDQGGCVSAEYGDEFDVLGGGPTQNASQLDPFHKANAGWFDATQFPTLSTPGTYTYMLAPYEQANTTGQPLALNIPRGPSGTSFTVEYRRPIGFDTWMGSGMACPGCTVTQGASVRLANYYTPGAGGGGDTQLIDNTPGTVGSTFYYPVEDARDGALLPGKTFTDPEYGISITAISADSSGLKVQVTVPTQTCIRAIPSVSVSPSIQTASPGQTKTYSLTVTNNDSAGCPSHTFGYDPNTDSFDVKMVASPDKLTLAPGASVTASLAVSSLPSILAGAYAGGGQVLSYINGVAAVPVPLTYQVSVPADTTAPTAPGQVAAQALGSSVIRLTWTAATDNVGVVGYRIVTGAGYTYTARGTSFVDANATPSSSTTYAVRAFDQKGNFSPAATVSVTTPAKTDFTAPSTPSLSSSATDHTITVSWTPSSDNVGVAYYRVAPCFVPNCSVPGNTTSLTVTGLPTQTRYDVQIMAYDYDGNSSSYVAGTITVYTAAAGTSAPSQPQRLISTAGTAGRVDLSWQASTDDKGVARYDIYRNGLNIGSSRSTAYSDRTVLGSASYSIQAVDGDGSLSTPSVKTLFIVPMAAGVDTQAPTASIWSPLDGASVGGSVTVAANASDNVGVSKVQLYVDGALKSTDTSAPWSFSLDTSALASGSHWLFVRGYDAAGNYGTNGVITVTPGGTAGDTTAPSTSIGAPLNGASVSGSVPVFVTATDNVGVTKVELSVDGSLLATSASAPYDFTWDASGASVGTHSIVARTYDAAGNTSSSSVAVTVADTTPPTVAITAPAAGATVSGTIQAQASASDDVGASKTELYVDGSLKSTLAAAPWNFALDTTTLTNGSHTLAAKVYDAAGNSSSAQVSVNVQNAPPDVTSPSKPSSLRAAVAGNTQVALYWTPSTDAVGVVRYEVSRDGVVVGNTTLPNYLDTGLAPGLSHIYAVRALDAAGNRSAASSNLNAKTTALSTSSTGTIAGFVYNSLGRPFANVIVQLTGNGLTKSTKTSTSGVYKFTSLPPGSYTLTITPPASITAGVQAATDLNASSPALTVVGGQTTVLVTGP
jgi:hypothetical protein